MNMYPIYDCLVHGRELPAKKRPNSDAGESPSSDVHEAPRNLGTHAPVQPNAKRQRYDGGGTVGRAHSPPQYRDSQAKMLPPQKPNNFNQDPREISQPRYVPYEKPKNQTWMDSSYADRRNQNQGPFVPHQRNLSNGSGQHRDDKYQRSRYRDDDRDIRSSNSSRSVTPPRRTEVASFPPFRDDDRIPYRDLENVSNRMRSGPDTSMKKPSDLPVKPSYSAPSLTRLDLPDSYAPTSPTIPGLTHTRQEKPVAASKPDAKLVLEENISGVIESLKAAMGGPETWMTVAAHYRRSGMHKHALAIVSTMLEGDYLLPLFPEK